MEIELKNITCERSGVKIFEGIDLTLNSGEKGVIQGSNGSGKSTLLRSIAGILPISSGSIKINNKADIFLLGHNQAIKQDFTVKEDLIFWSNLYNQKFNNELSKRLFLSNELNTQCKYLSQGQKQKLALSRLICSNKKIWLLDEPFSFLDNEASKNLIFEINNSCAKGGIVLIASHNDLIRDPNLVVNLE